MYKIFDIIAAISIIVSLTFGSYIFLIFIGPWTCISVTANCLPDVILSLVPSGLFLWKIKFFRNHRFIFYTISALALIPILAYITFGLLGYIEAH